MQNVGPVWSPDGNGVFFVKGNAVMFASLGLGGNPAPVIPTTLFETTESLEGPFRGVQDISADGSTFLTLMTPDGLFREGSASAPQISYPRTVSSELQPTFPWVSSRRPFLEHHQR